MSARRILRAGGLLSDGKSDYVNVLSFTLPQTFTITLWMRAYRFGADSFEWAFKHLYPGVWYGTASLTVELNLKGVFKIHGSDGNPYDVYYYPLYDEGVFTFVACICDGSSLRLYKNAVLVSEMSIPAPPMSRTDTLRLIYHGQGSSHTTMTARDFRVYDRPLSRNEIEAIYERDELIRDGLILFLDFSEGEGNIAYDKSGRGNHATIYGAKWVVKRAPRVLPSAR